MLSGRGWSGSTVLDTPASALVNWELALEVWEC
jgi:hypothetical protein